MYVASKQDFLPVFLSDDTNYLLIDLEDIVISYYIIP